MANLVPDPIEKCAVCAASPSNTTLPFRQLALEIESANEARLKKLDTASHAAFHVQRGQELLETGVPSEAEKEFREAVAKHHPQLAVVTGLMALDGSIEI